MSVNQAKDYLDEVVELANCMCDETITTAQMERLEFLLTEHSELRQVYIDYLQLNSRLVWRYRTGDSAPTKTKEQESTGLAISTTSDSVTKPQADYFQFNRYFNQFAFIGALACSLFVAFWLWKPTRQAVEIADSEVKPSIGFVATLREASNVVWSNTNNAVNVGDRIRPGLVTLKKGVAEIVFDSGARVHMAGPSELNIHSPLSASINKGTIAAHMPPTAVGFELQTPMSRLVDQGTEFGVVVDDLGATQVHVFRGQVDLHYDAEDSTSKVISKLELFDRQARKIDQPGSIGQQIAFSKKPFGSLANLVVEPVEWKLSEGGNGHFYQLVVEDKPITWHEAASLSMRKHFRGMQGHLVTVTSAGENNFVKNRLLSKINMRGIWMGLTDVLREGHYRWVTGEAYEYTDWATWPEQQPDNFFEADWHGGEDYGLFAQFPGKQPWAWNDLSIDSMHEKVSAYLVEYEAPVEALKHGSMALDPIHWSREQGGNGHYYQMILVLESKDWETINSIASSRELLGSKGHLVALESKEERQFVADNVLRVCGIPELMIGLTGSLEQGDLHWVNGAPVEGFDVVRSHLPADMVYGVFRWNPAGKWQTGWEIQAMSYEVLPAGWFGYLIEYPVEGEVN